MSARDPVMGGFGYTDHLVTLVGRAEAAGARLAAADPQRRAEQVARARRAAALASARLDASPIEDATAADVDARLDAGFPPVDGVADDGQGGGGDREASGPDGTGGSWARALRLDGMPTQDVAALEYANLLAAADAEQDLAERLFDEPAETLASAHRLLCRGLLDAEAAGRLRRTEQAVHDGAQGQVVYHTPPPERLPGLVEALAAWLGHGSARLPTLVVAGVVHERLLEWQPFEAAGGRLARLASRLVLRARGLDPHGAAAPEQVLLADALGYYREVAATIRRRGDLGPWLERYGEALCLAMEAAADAVEPSPPVRLPLHAARYAADLAPGRVVSLREYADAHDVSLERARADLAALERAGELRIEPGTRGLRYRRTGGRPGGQA